MIKVSQLVHINWIQFFVYNFFSTNIKRDKGKYIVPYYHSAIDIHKTASVSIHDNLIVNGHEVRGSKIDAILFLRENSRLTVNGRVTIQSGATLQVQKNACLDIGRSYINHNATVIAANHMKIGDGLLLSRNAVIFDSDFHKILNNEGEQINLPRDVEIGNHVWIGVNSTILRGSKIEDGAVIAAGAVVGSKIKSGTMAAGNPARSYSEIKWEE